MQCATRTDCNIVLLSIGSVKQTNHMQWKESCCLLRAKKRLNTSRCIFISIKIVIESFFFRLSIISITSKYTQLFLVFFSWCICVFQTQPFNSFFFFLSLTGSTSFWICSFFDIPISVTAVSFFFSFIVFSSFGGFSFFLSLSLSLLALCFSLFLLHLNRQQGLFLYVYRRPEISFVYSRCCCFCCSYYNYY